MIGQRYNQRRRTKYPHLNNNPALALSPTGTEDTVIARSEYGAHILKYSAPVMLVLLTTIVTKQSYTTGMYLQLFAPRLSLLLSSHTWIDSGQGELEYIS